MPLPDQAYKLDDRTFQELVNEARLRIPELCPQWTDHNLSDPGITLIELFARMVEQLLYRVNKVPAKNYIKFLDLIGVTLMPASAAVTDITFRFTSPIPDQSGMAEPIFIRKGTRVSNNTEDDAEESIIFSVDRDFESTAPVLNSIMISGDGGETFRDFSEHLKKEDAPVALFQGQARKDDAFYLGFTTNASGKHGIGGLVLSLSFQCKENSGIGINPSEPPLAWEYWNGTAWAQFQGEPDSEAWLETEGTGGFNHDGRVVLHVPGDARHFAAFERPGQHSDWMLAGGKEDESPSENGAAPRMDSSDRLEACWIRCRIEPSEDEQNAYSLSPQIGGISASAIGCTVRASNVQEIRNDALGRSNGKPGQSFKVSRERMLPLREAGHVYGSVEVMEDGEWKRWQQVGDFSQSTPIDRHFVCSEATGEVFFGPLIRHPVRDEDGQLLRYDKRQHGYIPPLGAQVRLSSYRYGGGETGNVPKNTLRSLRTTVPKVKGELTTNRRDATGGADPEELNNAMRRGPDHFRTRERAVTAADFEYLATLASSEVGKAKCIQPTVEVSNGKSGDRLDPSTRSYRVPPGLVEVYIFPKIIAERGLTRNDVKCGSLVKPIVRKYLDERRLLGSILTVEDANCKWASVKATIVALPNVDEETVRTQVEDRLYKFIHPISGGTDGKGWPFGRHLVVSELYHQIQQVPGVMYVKKLNVEEGHPDLGKINTLGPDDELELGEAELLCSLEHTISVGRQSGDHA